MKRPWTTPVLRRACPVLVGAFLLGSCQGSPTAAVPTFPDSEAIPSPLSDGFWLGYSEVADLDGGNLQVWFQELAEDSRCPSDVVCVWEGRARIVLVIRVESSPARRVELTLGGGADPSGSSERADGYAFTLNDLTPRPISTESPAPSAYRALLSIERLD
jgi:hypothetical protein